MNKVRAQVAPFKPTLASQFLDQAQAILDRADFMPGDRRV